MLHKQQWENYQSRLSIVETLLLLGSALSITASTASHKSRPFGGDKVKACKVLSHSWALSTVVSACYKRITVSPATWQRRRSRLNSQRYHRWYLIYWPRRDERLSWPKQVDANILLKDIPQWKSAPWRYSNRGGLVKLPNTNQSRYTLSNHAKTHIMSFIPKQAVSIRYLPAVDTTIYDSKMIWQYCCSEGYRFAHWPHKVSGWKIARLMLCGKSLHSCEVRVPSF